MNLLIIGIGQSMRSDDGAGLAALRHWQQSFPDTPKRLSITIDQAELPGLDLLNLLEGFEAAILIDAVQSDAPPGTIHKLTEADLLGFSKGYQTAHGWGVAESLRLARQLGMHLPKQILLIGIEAVDFSPGINLSPSVLSALDHAAQVIEDSATIILNQLNDFG
jgi:hydrogenase maturation protease